MVHAQINHQPPKTDGRQSHRNGIANVHGTNIEAWLARERLATVTTRAVHLVEVLKIVGVIGHKKLPLVATRAFVFEHTGQTV